MGHYDKKEIREKVRDILTGTLGVPVEAVEPTATLKYDLMADSLDAIEISIQLEREFGVNITDYQITSMHEGTVEDIYVMIYELTR
jgi:acyl carrier protein